MKSSVFIGKCLFVIMILFFQNHGISSQEVKVHFEDKYPIKISDDTGKKNALILYITGDGGWNKFSENLMHEFEKQGFGVISLNSYKYFTEEKSPESFARDVDEISGHYLQEWNKSALIIVGYSFGADVASFLPGNLKSQLKEKVKKVALLSPSASTDFIIKISDLLGWNDNVNGKYKVLPEIESSQLPVVCILGESEKLLLKNYLNPGNNLSVHEIPGGHRFNDNFNGLVQIITS